MRSELGDSASDSVLIKRSSPADVAAYANNILVHGVSLSLKGVCNVSDFVLVSVKQTPQDHSSKSFDR